MDIKDIISRVNKLDNKEKLHVLNILKTHNVDFTKNTNGYFFNLTSVDEEIVIKILKCLALIETNRDLIRKIDKRREELLEYYKKIIQEKIDTKVKKRIEEYNKKLLLREIETCIIINVENISKIKKNNIIDDPDEMIKEYNKSLYKYEKDSVYANVISKIKAYNSSHKNTEKKSKERSEDIGDMDYQDQEFNMDDDYIDDDIVENEIMDDDNNIIDELGDEIVDNISQMDDEYHTHYSDEMSQVDENDNEVENEEEEDETYDKKEEMETNINYYKNLLNKKGYAFDDNKNCLLGYQEYLV